MDRLSVLRIGAHVRLYDRGSQLAGLYTPSGEYLHGDLRLPAWRASQAITGVAECRDGKSAKLGLTTG